MALITRTGTDFQSPEEMFLQQLKQRIDSAVSALAKEHHMRNTEEPTLSARLIQLIEDALKLRPIRVPGLRLEWESQTMGSIGRTEEANSGADIYISIVRRDGGKRVTKGMLVQAKREASLNKRSERVRLATQCRKMRVRTDEAFVWVFHAGGVRVVRAPRYAVAPQPEGSLSQWASTPGDLVVDGLRCKRGDQKIGRALDLPVHDAMNQMTSRLGAKRWFQFTMRN